jgi:hypothetical protein
MFCVNAHNTNAFHYFHFANFHIPEICALECCTLLKNGYKTLSKLNGSSAIAPLKIALPACW